MGSDITFEAWERGPVCRGIWQTYKGFTGTVIPWLAPEFAIDRVVKPREAPESDVAA